MKYYCTSGMNLSWMLEFPLRAWLAAAKSLLAWTPLMWLVIGFGILVPMSLAQEFPCGTSVAGSPVCPNDGGGSPCPDSFATSAVFKIMALDGTVMTVTGFADPNTVIGRSDPFAEGDAADAGAAICSAGVAPYPDTDAIVADACRRPAGWPEGNATRREVHTEILSLELVGPGATIRAGQPYFDSVVGTPRARFFKNSIGEVASRDPDGTPALDFPADSFFNVFVEVDIPGMSLKLYNKSPMVVQSPINAFPPDFPLPEGYVHDPSFSAVALFDEFGLPWGYLLDAGHRAGNGGAQFVGDARLALTCPVSFTVDSLSLGLDPTITMMPPNHVFADQGLPEQQVTVYLSSGVAPGAPPDISNARQPPLVGAIGVPPPPSFVAGDAINSLSYGHDGTVGFLLSPPFCPQAAGPGALYFSVSRTSVGVTCTDVWQNSRPPALEQAADLYASAAAPFGKYTGPFGFPAPAFDNIMAADSTHLGLRPDLQTPPPDQDNVTALELKAFAPAPPALPAPPDFFYGTFTGPSFGAGLGSTIYVYDQALGAFDPVAPNLVVFAGPATLGLDADDVIDALALSDVDPTDPGYPCFPMPNKLLNVNVDEVLFSLAPGSPSLGGASPADIFYSDFDGTFVLFASAASLGLLATDDVDGIDIKPLPQLEQCNFLEGNGSGTTPGTDDFSGQAVKSLMQFEHFGTTCPAYLFSRFAEGNALRGTGSCTPDLSCTGTPEGEPDCTVMIGQPAPDDQFNSGCNATTPAFSPISCGETVCGEAFFLTDGAILRRDTDWWILHVDQTSLITWSVTSEFIQTVGILDTDVGRCPVTAFFNAVATGACTNGSVQECLAPGTYMLFAAPNFATNAGLTFSCRNYEATLSCAPGCTIACCIGESCVETDSFDCVQAQSGIMLGVGTDCSNPAVCGLGCANSLLIACGDLVAIDNTTNDILPNPFFTCAVGTGQIGVVWFEFIATHDSVYVNTCASIPAAGGDSTIAVYSGPCNSFDLTQIGCGEDEGCGDPNSPWLSETHVSGLTIGNTYYIQAAAWDAASRGQYLLDVVCPSPFFAPGPCCMPNGGCETLGKCDCIVLGGQWRGPEDPGVFDCQNGSPCADGACCDSVGDCMETTESVCEGVIGSTFIPGATCTSDDGFTANPCDGTCCGGAPFYSCVNSDENSCVNTWYQDEACNTNFWTCPRPRCVSINVPANCQSPALESVFGVDVAVPGNIIASSSDSNQVFEDPANPGVLVGTADMDDFVPEATLISEVCWWGFYADLSTNAPDGSKCLVNDEFTITFFNNGGDACPVGAPIASETVTSFRATTGDRVTASINLTYQYNASFTPVAVVPGQCYWIAITNNTDPLQTCRWLWVTAPFAEGNGRSLGTFTNDPTIPQNCADPNNRKPWDYAFCLDVTNGPCEFCGGDFCAGGTPEWEPICTNGYVDTFNYGCGASDGTITTNGNFTSVACGETVCGTAGNYRSPIPCPNGTSDCPLGETCQPNATCTGPDGFFRDTDWYEFAIPATDTYEWCVQSEFPYTTGLINTFGQPNCPMGLPWLTLAVGAACEGGCEQAVLDPGIYFALFYPQVFNGIPCGSAYTVSLVCPGIAPCVTTAARSCNDHGATTLCLDILANNIEPRLSGVTSVEIDIDAGVAASATVSCVNGGDLSASASVSQAGSTVTVTLAPALPDGDACTITLDCGASVCVRGLAGDIDRNGIVSTGDASIIKPHFGQDATTAGAEFDFDQNDIVSTGDASIVKPRFGNSAPVCP